MMHMQVHRPRYECSDCGRTFNCQNDLNQHARTHVPRTVACPGCGGMYRSMTDTALHFETGYCTGCPGRENARKAAYDLVRQRSGADQFLSNPRMLTYDGEPRGGWQSGDKNYRCPSCSREFEALGSLMQHQENRAQCRSGASHARNLSLGY